jgi:hypothetical protein
MEAWARALKLASTRAMIPKDRADSLHMAFMATDSAAASWTIGLESERWVRLDGEKWVAAEPPPELFVDSALRSALEGVEAMTGGTPYIPEDHAPFAGPNLAPTPAPTDTLMPETTPETTTPARMPEPTPSPAPSVPSPSIPAPPSIAPRLPSTEVRMEDDWSHVVLCIALAAFFVALGYWKADVRGFAAAGLFGVLAVTLTIVNLAQSRRE